MPPAEGSGASRKGGVLHRSPPQKLSSFSKISTKCSLPHAKGGVDQPKLMRLMSPLQRTQSSPLGRLGTENDSWRSSRAFHRRVSSDCVNAFFGNLASSR